MPLSTVAVSAVVRLRFLPTVTAINSPILIIAIRMNRVRVYLIYLEIVFVLHSFIITRFIFD